MATRTQTGKRQTLVVGLLLIAALTLITIYYREPKDGLLHTLQQGGSAVIEPLQSGASRVTDPFKELFYWAGSLLSAQSTVEQQRVDVARLQNEVIALREARAENERLRSLLGMRQSSDFPQGYTPLAARLIGRSPNPTVSGLIINQGSGSGVRLGQTVIGPRGLVGQISQVGPTQAHVLPITDYASKVEVKIQDSSVTGTLSGSLNGDLVLTLLTKDAPVKEGQVVVTSGTGGLFARGIPVGTVGRVSEQELEYFQRVSIIPFVEFSRLEELAVLLGPVQ